MTLPLELGAITDSNVRRAFEQLAQRFPLHAADFANDVLLLAVTGTARKIAIGTGTVTFTAAVFSAASTITHGLGTTPTVVLGTSIGNSVIVIDTNTYTSTTFKANGGSVGGVTTGTFGFVWAAIG